MTFTIYDKSGFESFLDSFEGEGNVISWSEVSDMLPNSSTRIWEFVYKIHLKHPKVSILIYSSIYKIEELSRPKGTDAVRLIYEWDTSNGLIYSKIRKRYRVENLFFNLTSDITMSAGNCFNLPKAGWSPDLQNALSD